MTKELSWNQHILVGGIARGTAITILYPLDTLKTIRQNSNLSTKYIPLSHLYFGYKIAILTQVPYGMIVFGMYENIKSYLTVQYPSISPYHHYITSAIAGDLLGSAILSPCEIVKQNMQIGRYKNMSEAYRNILHQNGLTGFYKGYCSLILRDIPFRAIQLPLYDSLKKNESSITGTCLNGAISGMVAGCITCPLDVVKTRMMCSRHNLPIHKVIRYLYVSEGMQGFFRGITFRTVFLGYSSSVFFLIYEFLKYVCIQ